VFGARSGPESKRRETSAEFCISITRTEELSFVPRIAVASEVIFAVVLIVVVTFASLSASLRLILSAIGLFVAVMNSTDPEVIAIVLLSRLAVGKHMTFDSIVAEDKYVSDVVVVDCGTVGLPSI